MVCKILVFVMASLIAFCQSARVNPANMDYNSLISLLSEYEEDNVDEMDQTINKISQGSNIPKYNLPIAGSDVDVGGAGDFSITKPSTSNLLALAPQVEVLSLIEGFLKLKAEMASRITALLNDNLDIFKSVYNVVITKISTLHSYTLTGINVIRKIVEFAIRMLSTWQVGPPAIDTYF